MAPQLPLDLRDKLITAFRYKIAEKYGVVPFPHQAAWWAASDGAILLDTVAEDGMEVKIGPEKGDVEKRALFPRPGGRARVIADLGAFKIGKSFSSALWVAAFAAIPGARVQLVGVEYDIVEPEFSYLLEFLCSDRGMGITPANMQNRPRDGRMWLEFDNGARFEAKSWERKDSMKGKEIDCYLYCLPLNAPVWMGDYSFRALEDVKIGDEVISGQKKGASPSKSHLQRATVTAIHRTKNEVLKLTFESGRVAYCTPDHKWLSGSTLKEHYILPRIGAKFVHVVDDPGPSNDPINAAWLAGMYDGEGSRTMIAQDREYNVSLHQILKDRLEFAGFNTTSTPDGVRWLGGMQAAVKFINQVPSMRYREKYADEAILVGRYKKPDQIIAIESCGVQDVGCITTTTGNFIAYGYQTSNCEAYMLPGLECYTSFSQNLRARNGYAVFATTPDKPWVKDIHNAAHSGLEEFKAWHCTCSVHSSQNPFTFDKTAMDRDRSLMTREKFAIHYEGKLGDFVGRVYAFQRGERAFSERSHPHLFARDRVDRGEVSIPDGWELVGAADTGTFTSALLVAFSPEGEAFVIDEFPNYGYVASVPERDEAMTIPTWARELQLRTEALGGRTFFWADSNSQFKKELSNYNITLMANKTPLEARTEITREYFQNNRIWLAPWLKILPFELENAAWPEEATAAGKFARIKDRDHTLDCLEHILSRRPKGKWMSSEKAKSTWAESYFGKKFKSRNEADPHLGAL